MVATRVWDDLFSGAMLVAGTVPWPQMPEVVGWGGFVLQSVDTQNMFFSAKTLPEKFPNLKLNDGFQFLYCTSQIGNSDCINHLN